MSKLQPKDRRVDRFLRRHLAGPAFRFEAVEDPRSERGKRYGLVEMLGALMSGLLIGAPSFRDVEALRAEQVERGRQRHRIADTTLYELVSRLSVDGFRVALRTLVRTLWRSKCLEPSGLPCGVMSVDGKGIGTLTHDAEGSAQKAHRSHDGSPYWLPRVLRAVLTSTGSRPCVDQMTVPQETNEMGAFGAFFAALIATYDALFEVVTVDAGMVSRQHADMIHAADKSYVMALKGTQPELLREARRLLDPMVASQPPVAETGWQRAKGKQVRRRLWRTVEIAGYHGWDHLAQAWLVRTEARGEDGVVTVVEDRYFLTSVRSGRLTPSQILLVVRGHWGIENDCFGTLDLQWSEDDRPWCTKGHAVEVLGILRLMAYDLLQLLRTRHLRERRSDGNPSAPHAWRQIFGWARDALRVPALVPNDA